MTSVRGWWEAELSCGGTEEWGDDQGLQVGDPFVCEDHGPVTVIRIEQMTLEPRGGMVTDE